MKDNYPYTPMPSKAETALCFIMASLMGFAFGAAIIIAALAPQV